MNEGNIVKEIYVRFKKLRKTCKKHKRIWEKFLAYLNPALQNELMPAMV